MRNHSPQLRTGDLGVTRKNTLGNFKKPSENRVSNGKNLKILLGMDLWRNSLLPISGRSQCKFVREILAQLEKTRAMDLKHRKK